MQTSAESCSSHFPKTKIERMCSSVQTCLSVDDLPNTAEFQQWWEAGKQQ